MIKQNKFKQIYEEVRRDIIEGIYAYGTQLPSENQLVEQYDVSRETVRKSLNMLVADGMIQKIRGKGSVVIFQGITEFPFADLVSYKEVQRRQGKAHHTELHVFEKVVAGDVPTIQQALNVSLNTPLWHIVRHRKMDGHTKIIDEDYLLYDLFPDLSESHLLDSLYAYVEQVKGYDISFSSKSITFEAFGTQEYETFGDVTPNYTATVRGIVHLKDTTKFQYNISKHLATEFCFVDFSRRQK
ncbi:trehalose operon repressor [Staphylococcus muscae]|uniref:Trehalose operon repressor n=1 Tax=Staphylococcus muscae TaxID=1294 RepID=A0A240BUQ3_9STAP|nr:trehalose operon repressor [Staphylococcus muscae]AVQ34065.1 trehalose operon repressor [Staphylococcus muscae]PNZ06333.1 trehalose operon repressor [Staphylococcus muscae]GGA82010.1 trehalose operon repressor [Staphylococcus muscae]SNV98646.1 trehalose operon transcriptional repressor [Staphylococcus muscae]